MLVKGGPGHHQANNGQFIATNRSVKYWRTITLVQLDILVETHSSERKYVDFRNFSTDSRYLTGNWESLLYIKRRVIIAIIMWVDVGLFIPLPYHYSDVIMGSVASQITSPMIVNSIVYSGADQRKHQSSASLAFVGPVNSPHKWPVTRKMFPFDDVIMSSEPSSTHD